MTISCKKIIQFERIPEQSSLNKTAGGATGCEECRGSALFAHVPASECVSSNVCVCHATLCLLLSKLRVDPSEQCREKSRKMPLCSGSESKDSRMLSIMISELDEGLGLELVS